MSPLPGQDKTQAVACPVCVNAEKLGGAVRCRACGRWIPRIDRPSQARSSIRPSDRRAGMRLDDPPCPRCPVDEARPRVTIRLPQRLFFKCDTCRSVWTLELKR